MYPEFLFNIKIISTFPARSIQSSILEKGYKDQTARAFIFQESTQNLSKVSFIDGNMLGPAHLVVSSLMYPW